MTGEKTTREIIDGCMRPVARRKGIDWDSLSMQEKDNYFREFREDVEKTNVEKLKEEKRRELEMMEARRNARKNEALSIFMKIVPPKYTEANISDFSSDSRPVSLITGNNSCLILGPCGIGKSHLLWACAKYFVEQEANENCVRIINLQDLVGDVKENGKNNWAKYIKSEYGKVRHLLIDEFDKTYGSLADYTIISDLVSYRYDYMLPTVITGNGDTQLALDILGPAVFSRITAFAENGGLVVLKGEDRRRANV